MTYLKGCNDIKIRLINGYGIDVDPSNYILVRERYAKDKNGNHKGIIEQTVSYHGTIDQLLRSLIQRIMREKVANEEVKQLDDFLVELLKIKGELNALMEKI